jgi:TolB-like protein
MLEGEDADAGAASQRRPTLFLSYASEDRPAAQNLRDALLGFGLEVWYDESELGGGEAWDQKIRKQIRECDYLMPVVSAQTNARLEGYFRREWRLAVERTQDMADDHLYLLPVVIDDTDQASARVPERFLSVQWLKVPAGRPTAALEALCRRLVAGDTATAQTTRKSRAARRAELASAARPAYPDFPAMVPGNGLRSALAVLAWAAHSVRALVSRLPRWMRVLLMIWLVIALVERSCSSDHDEPQGIPPATAEKLKTVAKQLQASPSKSDVLKMGAQIASELAKSDEAASAPPAPLLAIPFTAPAGPGPASQFADSTFATVYGKLAVSRRGHVALAEQPLASGELGAALERGAALHATYVLYGTVEKAAAAQVLTIHIASVENHSIVWSKSYPVAGANTAAIAKEVDAKVPALEE